MRALQVTILIRDFWYALWVELEVGEGASIIFLFLLLNGNSFLWNLQNGSKMIRGAGHHILTIQMILTLSIMNKFGFVCGWDKCAYSQWIIPDLYYMRCVVTATFLAIHTTHAIAATKTTTMIYQKKFRCQSPWKRMWVSWTKRGS